MNHYNLKGKTILMIITIAALTAAPEGIIKTGIYRLKPWVAPYEITKRRTSGGRRYSRCK